MVVLKPYIYPVAGSGVLFCVDQIAKYIAHTHQVFRWYIIQPWLGWEYFENTGIAFSLPFPQLVLIGITPLILLWFFIVLRKHIKKQPILLFSLSLIFLGATSNLIDRMLFGITIDYIRIATAILNIADIMIATGVGLIIINEWRTKKEN